MESMSVNKKLLAGLFCRPIGVWDDECQVWRAQPSTDYRPAARHVVSRGLTPRDPEWYAVGGRNGHPLDLNDDEQGLVKADEAIVRAMKEEEE
jgi:hypothetical protein